jgi:3-dehydroquinate synthase class II
MPVTYETIAANSQLVEHLADLSDVQLVANSSEPAIYTVEGAGDIQVIGRDGSGGQFALSQATGQMFHFSSEGEAGAVAKDFATFITIVVALPFWRDVLKFSGHGKIAEMRRVTELLEDDLFEDEDVVTSRDQLAELLELDEEIDVVAELHAAASSKIAIHDPSGNLAQSLFGRFTIEDNPMWRTAAG